MLKNYLKIAFRGIRKNPGYAGINIFGLTTGISCFLLIFLVVRFELSFDRFHDEPEHIFRIDNALHLSNGIYKYPNGPSGVGPSLLREVPQVTAYTRLAGGGQQVVFEVNTELYRETELFYADSTFFEFFNFALIHGEASEVLDEPLMAVLTRKSAMRYFGKVDAVGEILTMKGNNEQRFQVSGIMEDLPANSHIQLEVLLSNETRRSFQGGGFLDSWTAGGSYSYIRLKDPTAVADVESALLTLRDKNVPEEQRVQVNPSLMAFNDIHLRSNLRNEIVPNGNIDIVYVFSAIAVFILLIASINYMNLATARSAKRAKEVGMRKVLGAVKGQLVRQFMGESIVLVCISTLLSFILVMALLGTMASFTGKALTHSMLLDPLLIGVMLLIIVIVGFGSGSYPALFLSSFKPVVVLKGKLNAGMAGSNVLRKGLVVFQFAISIMLMIGTYTVYNQLNFMKNKSLGFQKEDMLVIANTQNAVTPQLNAFKNELLKNAQVASATASMSKAGGLRPIIFVKSETIIENEDNLNLAGINTDFDYMSTMGINIVEGRDFDRSIPTDSTRAVILNKQAAKELNMLDDPIGKIIEMNIGGNWQEKRVIGLVDDVNFEPLQRKTESVFYGPIFPFYLHIFVKISPDNRAQTIDYIRNTWNQFVPQQPFEYSFLEDDLNGLYASEEQLSQVVIFFALLAIMIACLGLFGLASFSTEQRIKEIGVRKVLGATVGQVLVLLSKDFVLLIVIAFVVAAPASYFLTDWWLQNFAFAVNVGVFTFVFAGVSAVLTALLTVSYKALNAARSNPVKALRFE